MDKVLLLIYGWMESIQVLTVFICMLIFFFFLDANLQLCNCPSLCLHHILSTGAIKGNRYTPVLHDLVFLDFLPELSEFL